MLVQIHMIQNHAPCNLNRDDTGSPKEAVFGGVDRARISSQCLKRSIRQSAIFREAMDGHLGIGPAGCQPNWSALRPRASSRRGLEAIALKATVFGSDKESDRRHHPPAHLPRAPANSPPLPPS